MARMTKAMRDALRAKKAGDRETLFWSERGAVNCAFHMPYPGTDTWIYERWMLMAWSDRDNWETQAGAPPKCEVCG